MASFGLLSDTFLVRAFILVEVGFNKSHGFFAKFDQARIFH
jgi:hypothetical protein